MEPCAAAVKQWMTVNKLKLTDSKSELLIIAPKYHHAIIMASHPAIKVGDDTIEPTACVRNLGVTFDAHLSMTPQTYIVKGKYYHLRRITKIRCHLYDESATQVIHTLLTSRLDHNNSLLAGTSTSTVERL